MHRRRRRAGKGQVEAGAGPGDRWGRGHRVAGRAERRRERDVRRPELQKRTHRRGSLSEGDGEWALWARRAADGTGAAERPGREVEGGEIGPGKGRRGRGSQARGSSRGPSPQTAR